MKNCTLADDCYGRADKRVEICILKRFQPDCHTEGAILSGQMTVTGRDSGETVKAPKGQVSVKEIISQAKGQSMVDIALVQYCFSEVKSISLAFYYFIKLMEVEECIKSTR